jgi:endoglucanase
VKRLAIPAVLAACSVVACEQGPVAAAGERRLPLAGINLAGGEFNAARKPGRYGKDYIYPSARTAAPFAASGMQIVRVPVLWERLQPQPGEPLDDAEMKRVDKALEALGSFHRPRRSQLRQAERRAAGPVSGRRRAAGGTVDAACPALCR